MSARPATFKQADLERAIRGVQKTGLRIGRVEIGSNGKIQIYPETGSAPIGPNPWDDVLQ